MVQWRRFTEKLTFLEMTTRSALFILGEIWNSLCEEHQEERGEGRAITWFPLSVKRGIDVPLERAMYIKRKCDFLWSISRGQFHSDRTNFSRVSV
uniref:Uncharacterized protein n=1 Tax=Eptatretus burgeri TaxID=7764 RepID=A0A8C4NGY0_EPTBU